MITYKEFSEFHDKIIRAGKKPRPSIVKWIYYPLFLLIFGWAILLIRGLIENASRRASSPKYSQKYRKVIKEGILWDNVEYHER